MGIQTPMEHTACRDMRGLSLKGQISIKFNKCFRRDINFFLSNPHVIFLSSFDRDNFKLAICQFVLIKRL